MGMIPSDLFSPPFIKPCPHTHGDDPGNGFGRQGEFGLSPHAWG